MCRGYNWHSVSKQVASLSKLQPLPVQHVLPGHGRPGTFASPEIKDTLITQLIQRES